MYPQKIDAPFYAHSIDEVKALALREKFKFTISKFRSASSVNSVL